MEAKFKKKQQEKEQKKKSKKYVQKGALSEDHER